MMLTQGRKPTAVLYVDRSCQQWVVRDPAGNFWVIPSSRTLRTIVNRSNRLWKRNWNSFPDITKRCLNFPFEQHEVHHDR